MKTGHKAEALAALNEIIDALTGVVGGKALTPLEAMKLAATAGYVKLEVDQIQELQRSRAVKKDTAVQQ